MKPRITLEEAVGQRLVGQIGNYTERLLVFESGYLCLRAELDPCSDDSSAHIEEEDLDDCYSPEQLASTGLGTLEEFQGAAAKRQEERDSGHAAWAVERARDNLGYLAKLDPEAARKLCAEVLK